MDSRLFIKQEANHCCQRLGFQTNENWIRRPTGFSSHSVFFLFCNDLPYIANDDNDTEIEMYPDDTSIYVIGATTDLVTKLSYWMTY